MSDNNMKDAGAVIKHGGGVLRLQACSDVGVVSNVDFTDLGHIEVTEFVDDVSPEIYRDETGNQIKKVYQDRVVQLTATLMQTNVEILDFIKAAETLYYQLYYKASKTNDMNGKTQELFGAICQITPSIKITSGAKRIPIEILFLQNENAITISTPATNYGSVRTTDAVIAANGYYKIYET
jgi:hypothetical protein